MPSTAAAGRAAGSTTCQNSRRVEHPSIRAASISSPGSASDRYCVMKNTPNALTSAGTMTALRLSVQPILAISMYSGMIPSWVGTIIVITTATSSPLRPRNFSLANANPASVANSTTDTAVVVDTTSELSMAWPNGTVANTRLMLSIRCEPGSTGGGTRPSAELSCEATTPLKYKGNAEKNSTAIRLRYASRDPRRLMRHSGSGG